MQLEIISREPRGATKPTPLLFVHGAWHAAWCWDEYFLPYFADHGYSVHALSLRGHGGSAGKLRFASSEDYIADVRQVTENFAAQPVIIGHSMGGYVTQKYLERYEAAAGVLLASIPTIGSLPFFLRLIPKHPLRVLKANLTMNPYHIVNDPEVVREMFFSPNLPDERLKVFYPQIVGESYRMIYDSGLLKLPKPKRVRTPLLVLGAENDKVFTLREVQATARAYGTQAEIFPAMAHDMMLEPDWQKVADRILRWMEEMEEKSKLKK